MAEDQVPGQTVETPSATPVNGADGQATTPAADQLDLSILDRVSPDDLIRHPRVAGILGDRLQRKLVEQQQQWDADQQESAAKAERERLRTLRREDPVSYAEVMETVEAQQEREQELAKLRGKTRDELAKSIGKAAASLPEWSELTQDDLAEIAGGLAGKSDDEVLPIYTQSVIKKLASRMAARQVQAEVDKRVAAEKKAWQTQWEAERLSGEASPDLTRPKGRGARIDPATQIKDDREFNKWYEEHFK